jgi:cytochrome P450
MGEYINRKKVQHANSKNPWKQGESGDILDFALSDPLNTISIPELVDQLKTFFFAGHDSTASTISWSYYFLSHNPAALSALRAELDEVFGIGTTPEEVARQLLQSPKAHLRVEYTMAVIKESLRLEPPAATARTAPRNYSFTTSSGKIYHPTEGCMLYFLPWLMHHDESVWGETAEEFRPERFLSAEAAPRGYMPFSKRPRDCIGSTLAYLEVRPLRWVTAELRRRLFWL